MLRSKRNSAPGLRAVIAVIIASCVGACTPDLQEAVGPRVAHPNVTGRVVREDAPVANVKVEIEDVKADSTYGNEYTGEDGAYAFNGIGPGTWEVRVGTGEPDDFDRVTFPFVFVAEDTVLAVPDLDVSSRALEVRRPANGDSLPVPTLFGPATFEWAWDSAEDVTFQVRVYDERTVPYWFSVKTDGTQLVWNGLGNMGDYRGRPAESGAYRWRLQVESGSGMEFDTDFRGLRFE